MPQIIYNIKKKKIQVFMHYCDMNINEQLGLLLYIDIYL